MRLITGSHLRVISRRGIPTEAAVKEGERRSEIDFGSTTEHDPLPNGGTVIKINLNPHSMTTHRASVSFIIEDDDDFLNDSLPKTTSPKNHLLWHGEICHVGRQWGRSRNERITPDK